RRTSRKRSTGTGDERNLVDCPRNVKNLWDMRQFLLLAAVLLTAVLPLASARAQESSDAAEIRALELKIADWYKHRQIESFAALLDDNFVITFEDGSTYSKTGYLSYSASSSTVVECVEISEMKIRMHGDTAVVTGVYHEKGVDSRQAYDYHDRFTDVWMKKSGKWRLVAAHYSVPTK
ncbi:MAG TPA: nuclear transport factor 2 family protein, partial [Dongiaceae bacterium]|nr:nuclear transport factor 2 family protein [Dongiaceae bacterium]